MIRATVLVRGVRVYRDSLKIKQLSAGGTSIVYCDNVEPDGDDWDRNEKPRHANLVFNESGADGGRKC